MQPLCSITITVTSSLLQVAPPQLLASVLSHLRFLPLAFLHCHQATGSRSSLQTPRSNSRHLYAGHHPHNNQVLCRLLLDEDQAPSFDVVCQLTTLQQWFSLIRLFDPYLAGFTPIFFNARVPSVAAHSQN